MLPKEDEIVSEIVDKLKFELQYGYALLRTTTSILTERHPKDSPTEDDLWPYRVGHALCFKACKTYRSILNLAEIGASHDMDILARSLFETATATLFVLKPKVELKIKGFSDEDLTSSLRSKIYAAHQSIDKYNGLLRRMKDRKLADVLKGIDVEAFKKDSEKFEQIIGVFWSERIKDTGKYSGYSLEVLAGKLDPDFKEWYEIYRDQSKKVHAVDGLDHVEFDKVEERFIAKWHPPLDVVRRILVGASCFMWRCVSELNHRFHFGNNPEDGLSTEMELEMAIKLLGMHEVES